MADDRANALADRGLGDVPSRIVPLSEHDEFEIADGYPEVRGWDVRDSTGRSIGYVYDLLVDVTTMRARYLDVLLDPEFAKSEADQRVLIPVESAGLDGNTEGVLLRGIDAAEVGALVPYAHRGVPRERETAVAYPSGAARLTLSEEEFAIGKRQVEAGAVNVRKTVETERVSKKVPVVREEVEVTRRAVQPGEVITAVETRGDEIRIPIMVEEVVVEKRLVAKEVLVIRKRPVTEERTIETDVRREQVHVQDPLGRVRTSEKSDRPEARA
jgi:photosynthetic reaction center H subunit